MLAYLAFSLRMADKVMMSGLSFAVFLLSALCVHICGLVCGLYGDVLCSCDRQRDSLWTIHLHIWVPQTLCCWNVPVLYTVAAYLSYLNILFLLCCLLSISLTQSLLCTCRYQRCILCLCWAALCKYDWHRESTEVKFGSFVHCLHISVVWFCLHCLCTCLVYILSQIRWLF